MTVRTGKKMGALAALLCVCLLAGCGDASSSAAAPQPSDTVSLSQEAPSTDAAPQSEPSPEPENTPSADAAQEPPLSQQDLQVPAPDFLPEDLQLLYRCAYKMMIIRIGTYAIDATNFFPCDTPDTSRTYWDQLTIDGKSYAPALNHYQSWDLFYSTLDSIFTKEFLETSYLSSKKGTILFRPVDGRLYYLPTERGYGPGYEQETTQMDFVLLNKTPDQIDIQVNVTYAVDENANQAFRQAWLDGLISNTDSYTISLRQQENGWRFSQFDVPF